jgi:CRP-like cAMP-binding protein
MKTLMMSNGKLTRQPFVRGASPDFLNHLASVASEITFGKGEIIFRENEFADRFYLILSGKVGLETHRDGQSSIVIQTLGAGEALGWSWLFPPFQWHFTARALEPCRVLAFNAASLLVRAEEDPVFGYELMKRISRQVIRRLQATRERFIHKLALTGRSGKATSKQPAQRQAGQSKSETRLSRLRKAIVRRRPRRKTDPVPKR